MFVGLIFRNMQFTKHHKLQQLDLIYDQQFNSPETLNIATVTKLNKKHFFSNNDPPICIIFIIETMLLRLKTTQYWLFSLIL